MIDRLPCEIVESIFCCIEYDREDASLDHVSTLLHLALTCRVMYSVGKPFLHKTVYLGEERHCRCFLQVRITDEIRDDTVQNIIVAATNQNWKVSETSSGSALLSLFPSVKEMAWIETKGGTVFIGHHLSRINRSTSLGLLSINAEYHLIVPGLAWVEFASIVVPDGAKLEYLTITVWTGSQPTAAKIQTEEALHWIFERYPHLQELCIRIGHNAAGFGSRIERMKRSLNISNAVRQINDDRIRLEIAQYMFGTKNMTHLEDIFICLKLSWIERIKAGRCKSPSCSSVLNSAHIPFQ